MRRFFADAISDLQLVQITVQVWHRSCGGGGGGGNTGNPG
jgi:hypothetical protein